MVTDLPFRLTWAVAGGLSGADFASPDCAKAVTASRVQQAVAAMDRRNMISLTFFDGEAVEAVACNTISTWFDAELVRAGCQSAAAMLGLRSAPVAQLDRAAASEAVGQKFESSRAHHSFFSLLRDFLGRR